MSESQAGGAGFSVLLGVAAIFGGGAFASLYLSNLVRPGAAPAPSEKPGVYWSPTTPESAIQADCVIPEVGVKPEEDDPSPGMPSDELEGGKSP